MGKRGRYGTNKTGRGLLYLEKMCFDKENDKDFVIGFGYPSSYPYEHPKFGQENSPLFGSGFNKVKRTHIGHTQGYILYNDEDTRNNRLLVAKQELERYGYEIVVK